MKYSNLAVVVLSSFLFLNCGGKEEKKKPFSYETTPEATMEETTTNSSSELETHSETDASMTESVTADSTAVESSETAVMVADIMIHGDDKMMFDLKEIKVKQGQNVKLTLMHTGKMAKNVMGHNFVLLKQGVNMAKFAGLAASAAATDYVPEGTEDVIAHTKLLGGGETDVIEFPAPAPGTYEFLCSFPGHYALMKGKFIVE
ncbi:azurin [Formosa sp. S-31]|uniref:azurin n=1 Tax=Formosa sp. S-31 TaxID=2790949 RepID=UPI003EB77BD1